MVFRLPWSSGRFLPRSAALQQNQQSKTAPDSSPSSPANFEEENVNEGRQPKGAASPAGGWPLQPEMTAREKAQTFVVMSGFPMPFLP
mmetsp:Transcript_10198/g.12439  ORF Transcript_10198/g.12439 Transcript_10198/m.12439 type:complete len:88 (-) Transcript_10198:14-277(-)